MANITVPIPLGVYLKELRLDRSFSQVQLSEKLGISRQNLCDLEKGRRGLSIKQAVAWAEFYKIDKLKMVELALQNMLDLHDLPYAVKLSLRSSIW